MRICGFALVVGLMLVGLGAFAASNEDNWPTWRGPNSDGVAVNGNPPLKWSEKKNVKWKVALPGSGSKNGSTYRSDIIVFRPGNIYLRDGKKYLVTLSGLYKGLKKGKVQYIVEFFDADNVEIAEEAVND